MKAAITRYVKPALLVLMALFYIGAGIRHFTDPEFYLSIMPDYLPLHAEAVFVSGVAEIVLGIALLIPRTRSLAAWGVIALLIAVFPANIHMATEGIHTGPGGREVSDAMLWIRLPLQAVLIAWAWWYTEPRVPREERPAPAG